MGVPWLSGAVSPCVAGGAEEGGLRVDGTVAAPPSCAPSLFASPSAPSSSPGSEVVAAVPPVPVCAGPCPEGIPFEVFRAGTAFPEAPGGVTHLRLQWPSAGRALFPH